MLFVIWVQSYDVFFIKLQAKTKQKPTKTKQIQKFFVSLHSLNRNIAARKVK